MERLLRETGVLRTLAHALTSSHDQSHYRRGKSREAHLPNCARIFLCREGFLDASSPASAHHGPAFRHGCFYDIRGEVGRMLDSANTAGFSVPLVLQEEAEEYRTPADWGWGARITA